MLIIPTFGSWPLLNLPGVTQWRVEQMTFSQIGVLSPIKNGAFTIVLLRWAWWWGPNDMICFISFHFKLKCLGVLNPRRARVLIPRPLLTWLLMNVEEKKHNKKHQNVRVKNHFETASVCILSLKGPLHQNNSRHLLLSCDEMTTDSFTKREFRWPIYAIAVKFGQLSRWFRSSFNLYNICWNYRLLLYKKKCICQFCVGKTGLRSKLR